MLNWLNVIEQLRKADKQRKQKAAEEKAYSDTPIRIRMFDELGKRVVLIDYDDDVMMMMILILIIWLWQWH